VLKGVLIQVPYTKLYPAFDHIRSNTFLFPNFAEDLPNKCVTFT